ncbi:type III secretion protein [bacterium 1XD21-13]|nr:type III secretion protein [bacterium 1XD21-13]
MSQFNEVMNKKAVALKYDENRNVAPVIVASGMGYLAEKIVEVANDNGVPVYEDNSLATVLTQLNLGSEIPEELYQAVVDIYAYFLKFVPKEPQSVDAEDAESGRDAESDSAGSSEG